MKQNFLYFDFIDHQNSKCFTWSFLFLPDTDFCTKYQQLFYDFLAVHNSSIGDLVPWLVGPAPLTIREFTTLQSDPRDL